MNTHLSILNKLILILIEKIQSEFMNEIINLLYKCNLNTKHLFLVKYNVVLIILIR
jgi:hypothetical protein